MNYYAALEVQVTPRDIEISHQLRRKKGNSPIIAKFCSLKEKTSFYKARTKLKNIKASDLLPSASYAAVAGSTDRLFVNENLTSYRRGLVDSANRLLHHQCVDDGRESLCQNIPGRESRQDLYRRRFRCPLKLLSCLLPNVRSAYAFAMRTLLKVYFYFIACNLQTLQFATIRNSHLAFHCRH